MRAVICAFVALAACQSTDVSRSVGARCDTAVDCNGRCLAPSVAYPAGFCTLDCASALDCPSDATCVDENGGVCLFTCGFDADCTFLGAGWTCKSTPTRDGGVEVKVCRGD